MSLKEFVAIPSIWASGPLEGDVWAKDHPEEYTADEARAAAALKQIEQIIEENKNLPEAEKKGIPMSLVYASISKKQRMNMDDRVWRKHMMKEDEDD